MSTTKTTDLERKLYHELSMALWWLENLAEAHGENHIFDSMPNGWAGRGAITEALREAEREHPDITEYLPGTFVTDGIFYGFITGKGTMSPGKIPVYKVNCGGDVHTLMPLDQARRV